MLLEYNKQKIVDVETLIDRVGNRPRSRKVVLCHGVFDIVHPGHFRHLLYASDKADVLVVSITADAFTSKGPNRPYVPQDLRAANLAAFDFVDYVVIINDQRPDLFLLRVQPDYYAKGFEYSETQRVPGATILEASILDKYGGEMLFTPGDFVQSSTALLAHTLPDLRYEKLLIAMRRAGVTFDMLRGTLELMQTKPLKVHVVGDLIVDSIVTCELIGASGKTPTMSVRRASAAAFVGGAGVVAKQIALACNDDGVCLTTVLGDDDDAEMVMDDLEKHGVRVNRVADLSRPTTRKEVILVEGYRILKIDTVDNRSISDLVMCQVKDYISGYDCNAVVFSDFRHGMFNKRTTKQMISAIPYGALRVADSQVASRWGNILEFKNFDLITPNETEARFALADQDSGIRPLASKLYDEAGCEVLLMKLGARGLIGCIGSDHEDPAHHFILDSFAEDVKDPVGAGDAFLAYSTLAMIARGCPVAAAILGSFAASVACSYEGNIPVAPDMVGFQIDKAENETEH